MPSHQMQFGPPCRDFIPGTGIFPDYLSTTGRMSPAPFTYHIASCLTLVSAVVCPYTKLRRVVRGQKREEILHMWTMLSGPPNNGKSYSAKMAKILASPILGSRIMAPIGSLQGLEDALRAEPYAVLYSNEASRVLRENRSSWMRGGGAEFWCDVFDGELPDRSKQERKPAQPSRDDDDVEIEEDEDGNRVGVRVVKKEAPPKKETRPEVRVCFLGASSTGHLTGALKPGDWEGGFMSRVMFILDAPTSDDDDDWFDWPDEARERLQGSLTDIEAYAASHPSVEFSPEAYSVFQQWSKGHRAAMHGYGHVHQDALARLIRHCRVTCALYALSCLTDTVTVPMVMAAATLGDRARLSTLSLPIS